MKIEQKIKTFDAVKMMREIRDNVSDETQNMTLEQLKNIAERIKNSRLNVIGR